MDAQTDRSISCWVATRQEIDQFSINYLAPYVRERPVPDNEFEACRGFAEQVLTWATAAVDALSGG